VQIIRSFESEHPSEVGGLLLGRVSWEPTGTFIVIEDVEFIEGDRPYFNASPEDLATLASALSRSPKRADLVCVGYFRSHIREGLFLSAEDGELAEGWMRQPDTIFLAIKPYENGICMAGFFFWKDGFLEREFSYLETPFGLLERGAAPSETSDGAVFPQQDGVRLEQERAMTELQTAIAELEAGLNSAAPAPGTHNVKPVAEDSSKTVERDNVVADLKAAISVDRAPLLPLPERSGKWWKIVLRAVAVVGIGLIAGYASFLLLQRRFSIERARSAGPSIGLHVQRMPDGQLDVTWNPEAFPGVTGGKLSIADGAVQRELNLDPQQLHGGKLAYFPSGSDVQFRLELFLNANRSVAESIRTVAAGGPEALPEREKTAERSTAVKTRLPFSKPKAVLNHNVPAIRHETARDHSDIQAAALPLPAFSSTSRIQTVFRLGHEASKTSPSETTPPGKTGPAGRQLTRPGPSEPVFADFSSPPAASIGTRTKSPPTYGGGERPAVTDYVGPAVVRQSLPRIPPNVAGLITTEQTIQITVDIDVEGTVTNARLTASKGATVALLGPSALDAARRYHFRPASRDGVPEPSQSVISFRFRP
jgi:TonB family protein